MKQAPPGLVLYEWIDAGPHCRPDTGLGVAVIAAGGGLTVGASTATAEDGSHSPCGGLAAGDTGSRGILLMAVAASGYPD
ncbi:hypothetical protein ACFVXC_42125 [Streptomyces sp. NPDC058257]|uniref:hypothetical protein n=1 Tax=Streptomyces sp. NPDC058257 TaxID=3346409 RepID=UPI0036EF4748